MTRVSLCPSGPAAKESVSVTTTLILLRKKKRIDKRCERKVDRVLKRGLTLAVIVQVVMYSSCQEGGAMVNPMVIKKKVMGKKRKSKE
jgi:hypothetical protein